MLIDQRIVSIQHDKEQINQLITEYLPFIRSWAAKLCGVPDARDRDEYSVALMAFEEAVRTYRMEKGGFLAFAKHVIRRRIIDYWRKNSRHGNVAYLDEFADGEEEMGPDLLGAKAVEDHQKTDYNENIRLEIEEYTQELEAWGIAFESLAEVSPKHKKSREDCRRIIEYIRCHEEIACQIRDKKKVPIQNIAQNSKVPQKKVEKLRKYIVAVFIVLYGDYSYIREYVVGGWLQ